MLTSIDVKFIIYSARLGLFSSINMSPFELSSCCSCLVFTHYFA